MKPFINKEIDKLRQTFFENEIFTIYCADDTTYLTTPSEHAHTQQILSVENPWVWSRANVSHDKNRMSSMNSPVRWLSCFGFISGLKISVSKQQAIPFCVCGKLSVMVNARGRNPRQVRFHFLRDVRLPHENNVPWTQLPGGEEGEGRKDKSLTPPICPTAVWSNFIDFVRLLSNEKSEKNKHSWMWIVQ